MRKLDEKALKAAWKAVGMSHGFTGIDNIETAITAYLSATPSEGGDGALREALLLTAGALQAAKRSIAPEVAFTGEWAHLGQWRISAILDKANAALALPAAAGWAVKPLEWVLDDHDSEWWATPNDLFGYEVRVGGSGKTRIRSPSTSGWHSGWQDFDGNVEAAKVAFQADFESRIRSAIVLTSKTGGDPASTGAGDD